MSQMSSTIATLNIASTRPKKATASQKPMSVKIEFTHLRSVP